jgi:hypothetical protein
LRIGNWFEQNWCAGCVFKFVGSGNFDEILEKYTSQVHLTPGATIDAATALLRRDVRNSASALDPINEITAAVPNVADPFVCERQVRSTLVDFCRANRSRYKNARVACLKTISFIVAPTTPGGQSVTYSLFFTFRVRDNCEEDPIFQHFYPSMAYQVEHGRLLNFNRTKLTRQLQLLILYEGGLLLEIAMVAYDFGTLEISFLWQSRVITEQGAFHR